jgi:hypothetical protein
MQKRSFMQALSGTLALSATRSSVRAQAKPIRVGSSLSLTGPLAGISRLIFWKRRANGAARAVMSS